MARYHINGKGEPGLCKAKKTCPFASEEEHYGSAAEARQAFEAMMAREELFQLGHKALAVEGTLPITVKRKLKLAALSLRQKEPLSKEERASLHAFEAILKLHEEARDRELAATPGPPELKRVGDVQLEEKEGATEVQDLSGRPLGTITEAGEAWGAVSKGGERLGEFDSKTAAVQAFQEALAAATTYHMTHQPDPDGVPGYDLGEHYPEFYERPHLYTYGDKAGEESARIIMAMRGNPEAEVTIYRALPDATYGIEEGNWVTLSKTYAETHAEQFEGDPWPVIELRVKAKDIRSPGDSINEWGYYPAKD